MATHRSDPSGPTLNVNALNTPVEERRLPDGTRATLTEGTLVDSRRQIEKIMGKGIASAGLGRLFSHQTKQVF